MVDHGHVQSAVPAVTSASEPPQGSPSVHLDALRGFAAFSVLLYHCSRAFFVSYHELGHCTPLVAAAYLVTSLGHQRGIVFFVMSG